MCRYCGTPLTHDHVWQYHGDETEPALCDLLEDADRYETTPIPVAA